MPRKQIKDVPPAEIRWRAGFVPPKGVDVGEVKAALDKLPEPSPEGLFEASKVPTHVLHDAVWSEGDQVWAQRGRLEYCRKIIGAVVEIVRIGGREIETRAVEFVRADGQGRWATIEDITADPDLRDAYLAEVQRLTEQATAKLARCRDLMRP